MTNEHRAQRVRHPLLHHLVSLWRALAQREVFQVGYFQSVEKIGLSLAQQFLDQPEMLFSLPRLSESMACSVARRNAATSQCKRPVSYWLIEATTFGKFEPSRARN